MMRTNKCVVSRWYMDFMTKIQNVDDIIITFYDKLCVDDVLVFFNSYFLNTEIFVFNISC